MPVTLRQLRYFKALVEQGSFTRAARKTCVSQPALSVQIRELEATLGGPIVERESRGVVLTRLGRDAIEQTLRILDETSLLESLGKRRDGGAARIPLGILSTLAPYLLPGIVERLQVSSPSLELNVVENSGDALVSELLANRLDAAIVSLPMGTPEIHERELFEDCLLLAGRGERLEAVRSILGDEMSPADLGRADVGSLLTLGHDDCLAAQIRSTCLDWGIRPVRRGAGSLSTLSRLIAGGAGLSLLPETAAVSEGAACPDLRFMRFAASEPSRRIGLAHRADAGDDRWIDTLAAAASEAGRALVSEAAAGIRVGSAQPLSLTDRLESAA